MCTVTAASTAVSTGLSVGGSLMQGSTASSAASANAANYRTQAALVQYKAKAEVEEQRRKFQRFQGEQLNDIGGSGLDARSFYGVLHDNAMEHALEVATIKWSAQNQVDQLMFQAKAAEAEGKSAKIASYINAGKAVASAFSGLDISGSRFSSSNDNWTTTVYRNSM